MFLIKTFHSCYFIIFIREKFRLEIMRINLLRKYTVWIQSLEELHAFLYLMQVDFFCSLKSWTSTTEHLADWKNKKKRFGEMAINIKDEPKLLNNEDWVRMVFLWSLIVHISPQTRHWVLLKNDLLCYSNLYK